MCRALATDSSVEKEKRASTSVETLPGTIWRISLPNCTSRLSRVVSTWFSRSVPFFLPYATAASISFSYSGFLDAARMSEGLVVASWGWYFLMVAKSPESATTVCRESRSAIILPYAWCCACVNTYGAGGLELFEGARHCEGYMCVELGLKVCCRCL